MLIDPELALDSDPYRSFATWYAAAESADPRPDAVALATADAGGPPSLRIVLFRGVQGGGFRFFTNYDSRKGRQLATNPYAALLFYWQPLGRQVRLEGRVEPLAPPESDAYFATRDRESQLSAWASRQSEPIASREALMAKVEALRERFAGGDVPRPEFWGGYCLLPSQFEFWHHRENRLHDRFRYTLGAEGWLVNRLSP